jgi:predicted PhzF superfamily epimerase YddE/YHI9
MNLETPLSTISVFAKGQLRGNQAVVGIFDKAEIRSVSRQSLKHFNEAALCLVSPDQTTSTSDSNVYPARPRYRIRCFSSAGPIHFCGHGLMAAAHQLFSLRNSSSPIVLLSGKQSFVAEKKPQGVKLFCPRITTQAHRTPGNISRCFDKTPQHVACAQGARGYWILNFADETDLSKLRINHARLKQFGNRAIIVTSLFRPQVARENAICHMRYFAPQYGAREDQATGSACIVIGDYWQKRLKRKSFSVIQQSKNGGFMTIECCENTIALGGDTRTTDHQENRILDLRYE